MESALIIGGTGGLGRSLAHSAKARGIYAFAAGRTLNVRDPEWRDGKLTNGKFVPLDITDPASWEPYLGLIARSDDFKPAYLFWVAGIFHRGPFVAQSEDSLLVMMQTHLMGPIKFLQRFHRIMMDSKLAVRQLAEAGRPYHLITIASTSSYRMRVDETLYCALKAAKAAFMRNFSRELARDLPGSKTMLVNPGGMKTNLFMGTGQDTSKFMEPKAVAGIIWEEVLRQTEPFDEINILRDDEGAPRIVRGPQTPEQPF
ncbi:MAG: SDR family oxidoreductase [Patescibacteria group bacterium]